MRLRLSPLLLATALLLPNPGFCGGALASDALVQTGEQTESRLPEQLVRRIRLDGRLYSLTLGRYDLRSSGFHLVQQQGATIVPLADQPPRTYRGQIENLPNAHVSAYVDSSGTIRGTIQLDDQPDWTFQGDFSAPVDVPLTAEPKSVQAPEPCTKTLAQSEPELSSRSSHLLPPARMYIPSLETGFHLYQMHTSIYLPWHVYQQSKRSLEDVLGHIEHQLDAMAMQVNRLGLVQLTLENVVIGAPLTEGDTLEAALEQFWQLKHRGELHGFPLFVTNVADSHFSFLRGMEPNPGDFWALCSHTDPFPNNVRMEHPVDFSTPKLPKQSRAFLRRAERDLSRNGRVDAPAWPLAPLAFPNQILVPENGLGRIDPTHNDLDANGDPLSLLDFDQLSLAGGKIRLDPESRELVYQPPLGFVGSDSFYYRVTDGTGRSSEAEISVTVTPSNLAGYWAFDDIEEPLRDASRSDNALVGHVDNRLPGMTPTGHGLTSGAYIAEPGALFDPVDGSFSVSFWFRHDGSDRFSVLASKGIYGQQVDEGEGWSIASQGDWLSMQLVYDDHDLFAIDWRAPRSELSQFAPMVRDGRWHHLVMVIDRDNQQLQGWIDNEPFAETAALPADGGKLISRKPLYFGQRRLGDCRSAEQCRSMPNAGIDEIRLYHRALSAQEIELLYLQGITR